MQSDRSEAAILHLLKAVRELQEAVKIIGDKVDTGPRGLLMGSPVDAHLRSCGWSIQNAVDILVGGRDE